MRPGFWGLAFKGRQTKLPATRFALISGEANHVAFAVQPQDQPQERWVMSRDNFLRHDGPAALDADEITEAVRELLMSSAPPALIRVIGRTAYQTCVPPAVKPP